MCWGGIPGGFLAFMGNKKRPDPWIRTLDTRYHPTFACGEYTTGALTADDALIAKRKKPWGGKIGALDNGSIRLFLRINIFAALRGDTRGQHLRRMWGGKHHFGKAAPGPLPRTLRKPYTDRLLSARNGFVYSVPSTRYGYKNRRYR